MTKIPNWIWTLLVMLIVFGFPRLVQQRNHDKLIEAAHESCRALRSGKLATQREALMAGMISSSVDLKGKTNSLERSVLEYGEILKKCGFDME